MNSLPPTWLTTTSALFMVGLLAACASNPAQVSQQRFNDILASPERSAADRTNDIRRKPEHLLPFMGLRPGMVALDVVAGGGYTTELLARSIGPTGTVYSQSQARDASRPTSPPAAPEGQSHPNLAPVAPVAPVTVTVTAPVATPAIAPRTSPIMVAERDAKLRAANVAAAKIVTVVQRFDNPVPEAVANAGLDIVTLMFNYHDLGHMGVDRDAMNRAIYRGLKSGGVYVIGDHAGRPGTGISEAGTLHRIDEAFLRAEVERAGFKLVAEGQFLRNPADPRDKNTPHPPKPKDEFVFKFVKP